MSTKKFKLGNADGNNVKGGRNNTHTILTAAGVVAFGAAAAAGGYAAGVAYGHPDPEPKPDEKVDEKTEEKPETQDNQQSNNSNSQQTAQQTQPQSDESITEPQPTDTPTQTQQVDDTQPQQPNITDGEQEPIIDNPEVDPNNIAQQIIEEQDIDPNDIDSPTIISVDALASLYRADGSEMLVAAVHTPDGSQFLLADVDGDGYFTDVFDMAGNYVGEAEGNLMASDLEVMVDPTGGYLAHTSEEPQGDDPTNDIINTNNPNNSDVAQNSTPASDEEANILAQLRESEIGDEAHFVDLDETGSNDDNYTSQE